MLAPLVAAVLQLPQIYFGNPLGHAWFSDGSRGPEEAYSCGRSAPRQLLCIARAAAMALTIVCAVIGSGCRSDRSDGVRREALKPQERSEEAGAGAMALAAPDVDSTKKLRGEHAFAGYPQQHASGPNFEFQVLENIGYAVGYSERRKDPLWACYLCRWKQDAEAPGPRPSQFKVDARTEAKVKHADYKQADYNTNPQSYDRGHMAPNFAIGSRYGRDAQLETFLMSNVCPQRSTLNQQPWEALEKRIATDLSHDCGEVWVTVGPIFDGTPTRLNGVAAIPTAFFAIIVDDDAGQPRVLALTFSQDDRGSAHTLRDHWTTVDEVEALTGLDFLTELEDGIENTIEKTGPDDRWDLDRPLVPTPHDN